MIAFDCFCGAGGLTRGLLDAGIEVLLGVDCDESCKRTFEFNNPKVPFVCEDIRLFDVQEIRRLARGRGRQPLLLAGCAPCQPFSRHNRSGNSHSDRTLLSEFGRIVAAIRPEFILVENVPEILQIPGYSTFRRFLEALRRGGYQTAYGVLDAKRFGVPQTRRRLVLIGSRAGPVSLPEATFGPGRRDYRTVRSAISHFPPLIAGEEHACVPNHLAANVSATNLRRLECTPSDGGDRRHWPVTLQLPCHRSKQAVYTDTYGRMAWDRPAPTLTARCRSISNGRYGHPEQHRAISLREAAALQTFPDGYEFFGSKGSIAKQIGNAVPVVLGEVLGRHILRLAAGTEQRRARRSCASRQ